MEYQTLDEQGRKGLLTAKLRGLEGQHYEATVNAAMAQAAGLSDSAAQFDAAASEIASGIGVVAGLLGG